MIRRIDFKTVKKYLNDEAKEKHTFDSTGKVKDEFCVWIAITEDTISILNVPETTGPGITVGSSVKRFHTDDPWMKIHADYQFKTKSEMQHFTEDDYNRICDMLEIEYKTKILNEKENKIKEDF